MNLYLAITLKNDGSAILPKYLYFRYLLCNELYKYELKQSASF